MNSMKIFTTTKLYDGPRLGKIKIQKNKSTKQPATTRTRPKNQGLMMIRTMRILPPTSASLSLARIRNVYYSSAAAASSSSSSTTTTAIHRHISLLIGGMASIYGSAVSTTTTPPVTLCEDNNNNGILDKLTKAVQSNSTAADWNTTLTDIASTLGTSVQTAIDTGIPTQLSYGFLSGYCSGLALKKVGRAAAVVFGTYRSWYHPCCVCVWCCSSFGVFVCGCFVEEDSSFRGWSILNPQHFLDFPFLMTQSFIFGHSNAFLYI